MTLVLDANVFLGACLQVEGFSLFGDEELVGPPLLWSETLNAIRDGLHRGEISRRLADEGRLRLDGSPVRSRSPKGLRAEAWRIAEDFGWAKTYDAEYLALASMMGVSLITLDVRLRKGASRLGFVLTPAEWEQTR